MKVVSTEALTRALGLIKTELGKKEPNITKKTGFNLDKTDTVQNNPSVLFTTKGAFDLKTELVNSINTKMDKAGGTFTGNVYFDTANEKRIQGSNEVGFYLNNTSGGTIGIYDWIKNKGVLSYNTTSQELGFGVPLRASSFIGALTGKSTTSGTSDVAIKLQTPRNIKIGEKTLQFDGTGNLDFRLQDIKCATSYTSALGDSYRKRVIGLIKLSAASTSTAETFSGIITAQRNNGIISPINVMFTIADSHSFANKPNVTIFGTSLNGIKPCMFVYNGVWYGGVEVFLSDATHNFIDLIGNIRNSNDNKPYVDMDYYDTRTGAINSEISNSISFDVYFQTDLSFDNYRKIYSEANKPTSADLGFFPSSGGTINGNTGVTGNLTVSGTINGSKTYNAVWNDYAEYFPKKIGYKTEPGDIIALSKNDSTEKYELATSDHVLAIGVHSDQYGHLIGGEKPPEESEVSFEEWNKDKYIPVGLAGRVPVKFIGVARKGMKVVPSDIPGVGKEYGVNDKYDNIIGYIVEDNDEEGVRRVKIKIGK